ncbi:MAG: HesA/MoeB/ThiF family protein [Pelotomaculum sp.]|uniref:Dinucleotide-utilizing enzymes n=1 Tax=Pelotomaculum thermopropionicum (strain DSM 13744 / JCM 10971 / SI) TaxID=370438 RepID=A5D4P6_PELTS|nr:HesA/MoeB/ThiF family protein [Pelotomaculum sp.]BAF58793.1 dinucleotide-utilizing enzymes [Pelotomaculum thermopropionicum SI]
MENERWKRQLAIPQFGMEAQQKLRESRVVVLGLGGVGGVAALYLAAAGVGCMVLVDRDVVELSNLNRQILFSTADIGKPKAEIGAERLLALDPGLKLEAVVKDIRETDLKALLQGSHFVLDGFDKNAHRLAVNRACVRMGLPAVHGFAQDFSSELIAVLPGQSACLACVMDENFPEVKETPVLGVSVGVIGVAMAAAAIRCITGLGEVMAGCRLIYDLAFPELIKIPLERDPLCPVCGR